MTYGSFAVAPALSWPVKEPDAYLDYSYDATADLASDELVSVSVSVAPSGTGEMVPASVSFTLGVVTVWLSGGVGGRNYVVKIDGTCVSGRVFEWVIGIQVDPLFATNPVAEPASTGFGTAVTAP